MGQLYRWVKWNDKEPEENGFYFIRSPWGKDIWLFTLEGGRMRCDKAQWSYNDIEWLEPIAMDEYAASLLKENEALKEEIAGLNRVISQMFADKVSETRELQSSNEKLKIERDKFEGGDELKSKKIIELEAWKESAMNIMSPMQEIGKAIGVKLGHSIHDKILPAIIVLKSSNEAKDRECEYWKARCEAAEVVLDTFPREVLLDQAGEDYHEYEQLKQKLPQRVIEGL